MSSKINQALAELDGDPPDIIYRSTRDSDGRLDSTTPIAFYLKNLHPQLISSIQQKREELRRSGWELTDWRITCEACKQFIWVEIVYFDGEVPRRYVEGEVPSTSPFPPAETEMMFRSEDKLQVNVKRTSLMISSSHGNRPFRVAFIINLNGEHTTLMTKMFRVQEKKPKPNTGGVKTHRAAQSDQLVEPEPRRKNIWEFIRQAYMSAHRKELRSRICHSMLSSHINQTSFSLSRGSSQGSEKKIEPNEDYRESSGEQEKLSASSSTPLTPGVVQQSSAGHLLGRRSMDKGDRLQGLVEAAKNPPKQPRGMPPETIEAYQRHVSGSSYGSNDMLGPRPVHSPFYGIPSSNNFSRSPSDSWGFESYGPPPQNFASMSFAGFPSSQQQTKPMSLGLGTSRLSENLGSRGYSDSLGFSRQFSQSDDAASYPQE